MSDSPPCGVLVVDKPPGMTSHDVVYKVRRALQTRKVGHAGTLDPMATGVLIVLVGAATKLSQFLTLDHKSYEATIRLGCQTDTWDAQGHVVFERPVPDQVLHALRGELPESADVVHQALAAERSRTLQSPPIFSAIKQGGVASYRRARQGHHVELPDRPVRVLDMKRIDAADSPHPDLRLTLTVSKGYYVRSLANDIGKRLGTGAHLVALRRTASGPFHLEHATPLPLSHQQAIKALLPLEQVVTLAMPIVSMTSQGACRAVQGKQLTDDDFLSPPPDEPSAWLTEDGLIVAIGDRSRERPTIRRALLTHDKLC